MRFLAFLLIPLLACEQAASRTPDSSGHSAATSKATPEKTSTTATALIADTAPVAPTGTAEVIALQKEPRPIRALYINRFAAQSASKMKHLIAVADSTEINAFVIDIKDEFGLNWHSSDPLLQRNEGKMTKVSNLPALVDTLRAHGILPIARMVVFKDSVAARNNPEHVIRKADGTPWRDKKGVMWVNPYSRAIWDYNFRVADEAVKMGFGEIQFDYVRFPEPYKSLPPQVFPEAAGRSKADALNDLLKTARARYDRMGVRMTADIFGLVTTVRGPLEVGQDWEKISPVVDVVLPMVYPSLYPHGSLESASRTRSHTKPSSSRSRVRGRATPSLASPLRSMCVHGCRHSRLVRHITDRRKSRHKSRQCTMPATTAGCSGVRAPSTTNFFPRSRRSSSRTKSRRRYHCHRARHLTKLCSA